MGEGGERENRTLLAEKPRERVVVCSRFRVVVVVGLGSSIS